MSFSISREIGIDAAHRVPLHGSKCKNLHGHRYTIQAVCSSRTLISQGEQSGMVLDFGFLKEEMMNAIDHPCDHATLFWEQDPLWQHLQTDPIAMSMMGKICVLPVIPTAENLAKYWFDQLVEPVSKRSGGRAVLSQVIVFETPNCCACYPAEFGG